MEEYHQFPHAGGWMDQDWQLLEDIKTYKRIQQRLKWEQEDDTPGEDPKPKPGKVYADDTYEEQLGGYRYNGG